MANFELSGKTALVTGAARGIGFATAKELHDRGARVCVVDLDQAQAQAAAAEIGERAYGAGCDVTDRRAIELVIADAVSRFEKLDLVVANAGIAAPVRTVASTDRADFDRVIAVNQEGVVNTVWPALPEIIKSRGHILLIASVYAFTNGGLAASYAMSKAAVEQLGRALRTELGIHGASAGVAYFGFVDTAMVDGALGELHGDGLMERIPRPLKKKIPPAAAGRALVDGIEKRAARTIRPRRWIGLSVLRGIVNPGIDRASRRDRRLQALFTEIEKDAAAGPDQG